MLAVDGVAFADQADNRNGFQVSTHNSAELYTLFDTHIDTRALLRPGRSEPDT
jgi:hypothetical protein